jgi:hypothetical protein
MNVKLIRMSSGEDVVATIVSEEHEFLNIQDAIVAIPTGQDNISFAPWSPIVSKDQKEIPVNKRFIVYIAEVNSEVADQYKQMFSKIVTPGKKLIV